MSKETKKQYEMKCWYASFTVDNEEIFKEMMAPLNKNARQELLKKLKELISDSVENEVTFSNYTLALIGRRMVELFCQEWYHSVPLVFLEGNGKTLVVDWRYPRPTPSSP